MGEGRRGERREGSLRPSDRQEIKDGEIEV